MSGHPLAAVICAEARTWLGTPYHDQACTKGIGVDCAGLILGVAQAVGLTDPTWRPPPYHPAWHVFDPGELLWQTMEALGVTPLAPGRVCPGDLLLFRWRDHPSHGHGAVVLEGGRLIHALSRTGVIVQRFTPAWQHYATRAGRYPEALWRPC
jgi:NlpC/P60 family putative phage cell wall peptidase